MIKTILLALSLLTGSLAIAQTAPTTQAPTKAQCTATTKAGNQCKRSQSKTIAGKLCTQHARMASKATK